ncbi:hypothetical protein J6590_072347 [Homalodisca vitripennis]|nr:hypothetical protein J6590_072347 [Homalodisca vitripennis]
MQGSVAARACVELSPVYRKCYGSVNQRTTATATDVLFGDISCLQSTLSPVYRKCYGSVNQRTTATATDVLFGDISCLQSTLSPVYRKCYGSVNQRTTATATDVLFGDISCLQSTDLFVKRLLQDLRLKDILERARTIEVKEFTGVNGFYSSFLMESASYLFHGTPDS